MNEKQRKALSTRAAEILGARGRNEAEARTAADDYDRDALIPVGRVLVDAVFGTPPAEPPPPEPEEKK